MIMNIRPHTVYQLHEKIIADRQSNVMTLNETN